MRCVWFLLLCCLLSLPALRAEEEGESTLLQDLNMYEPEDDAPAYKKTGNERFGTQWLLDMAYGGWRTQHAEAGNRSSQYALLHAILTQRLWENTRTGGTWLRVEFGGTWGLDRRTCRGGVNEAAASAAAPQWDVLGAHHGGLPEVSLMQYLNRGRTCIIGGVVNLTNYFDCVTPANDSFHAFANALFMDSSVLPLSDGNLGAIVQVQTGESDYLQLAATRTGCDYTLNNNPFHAAHKDGFAVVAEWDHGIGETAVLRVDPFYRHLDAKAAEGYSRDSFGLAGSAEWEVNDSVTLFARGGFALRGQDYNRAELSAGAVLHLIPSREKDFLGIAFGIVKGATPYGAWEEDAEAEEYPAGGQHHRREYVAELMYSLQLTPYLKLMPHYEFIARPAYSAASHVHVFGVQSVLSF